MLKSDNINLLIESSLHRAVEYALKIQNEAGYWIGTLDSNCTMEAEFVMLLHFLNIDNKEMLRKLSNHILQNQNTDGGWSLYYQGPSDLSTTVESYFALKLVGHPIEFPEMQNAQQFILAHGGIPKCRVFSKIWLALFGLWSWDNIPLLLPEIIFLPTWFPVNIYEFASWARATILPLSIVMTQRKSCLLPDDKNLLELYPQDYNPSLDHMPRPVPFFGLRGFFWLMEKAFRLYERLPWKFGRKRALEKVVAWIVEHQEADGSWGGIQPPAVYSLIALKMVGYDLNDPVMQKGLEGFDNFRIDTKDTLQMQACISPVWDTGLMMIGLQDAGISSEHFAMQAATQWLVKKQILVGGDWQVKNPTLTPGGWAFEFDNNHYPDIDDVSEILIALHRSHLRGDQDIARQEAIKRGTQWLIGMQSKKGGWGSFDQDNDNVFIAKFPFFDFGEMLDPPSVDVTAHVIEALGHLGYSRQHPVVRKGLDFIYSEQEKDGCWFGRWGVNYIYGIGAVLPALQVIGEDMQQAPVRLAVAWLLEKQNADGGWGETCASYADIAQKGQGVSTASQTAWAVIALISAGERTCMAVQKGIQFLCMSMNSEGSWDEPYYTGCGFPGYGVGKKMDALPKNGETGYQGHELAAGFMINYHLYRHYCPLMALGRFLR